MASRRNADSGNSRLKWANLSKYQDGGERSIALGPPLMANPPSAFGSLMIVKPNRSFFVALKIRRSPSGSTVSQSWCSFPSLYSTEPRGAENSRGMHSSSAQIRSRRSSDSAISINSRPDLPVSANFSGFVRAFPLAIAAAVRKASDVLKRRQTSAVSLFLIREAVSVIEEARSFSDLSGLPLSKDG